MKYTLEVLKKLNEAKAGKGAELYERALKKAKIHIENLEAVANYLNGDSFKHDFYKKFKNEKNYNKRYATVKASFVEVVEVVEKTHSIDHWAIQYNNLISSDNRFWGRVHITPRIWLEVFINTKNGKITRVTVELVAL